MNKRSSQNNADQNNVNRECVAKMNQEKQKVYSAECRASAVKLVNESDQSIIRTSKDLGINVNTLHTWISKK